MAAKVQHVHDNSVAERRLRPIYDWLDSGNNKKALQECDKVLKKTPNLHCAKALKALSLLRMGKDCDCITILDALTTDKPCDDATLQAMTLCYRELQQLNKICDLYETAVKLDPTNEELHTHLFMSYVRISDFKSQQKSAMALYKLKPKNPYYCWAVMSVILQATRGEGQNDPKKYMLLLSLAERMMDKLISDNKLEAEQEVQLYLMILDLQKKYEQIMKVYDGPLGGKIVTSTHATNALPYLMKLMRWREVNLLCKSILIDSIDKWNIWKEYINSVFELMNTKQNQVNNHTDNHDTGDNYLETVDDTPEKAHEFICRLIENGSDNGYLLRGSYLARFELCWRLVKQNTDTVDLLGETIELFIEYFRKFGHKPCCVSDLKIYLNLLDTEKKSELSTRLIKDVGISSTSVPQSEQQMQRHIGALQLSRLCGAHRNLSPDHQRALVTALSLHYQHGYQTYGTNLLSTDQGPSDPYALLAAHVLYDLSQTIESQEPMLVALVLLENLLKNSPSNFHAKLLCVRLYHTLGGGLGAHEMYESLDVKHLQLDSLGYLHCARLATTGLLNLAASLFDTTLKFFTSNYKDSSDHLTFSYKFGSFLKLEEFMDFREKLNNSLHYTTVTVDRIILNFVQCTTVEGIYSIDTSPKDNKIDWDSLKDNHDLSVYNCWDPERIEGPPENSEIIRTLFEQNVNFLKLRVHILYSMSAGVDVVKSTDGTRCKNIENLKTILNSWYELYTKISSDNCVPIKQNQVTTPLPSRLHCFLDCSYVDTIRKLFDLLICIADEEYETSICLTKEIEKNFSCIIDSVKKTIENNQSFLNLRKTMEFIVNNVEITCISSLICSLCYELAKPPQGKKGKKKTNENKSRDILNDFIGCMKDHVSKFDEVLKSWTSVDPLEDITGKLEALNLNIECQKNILQNLTKSHTTAVKELQAVLKVKYKLLNGLIG